MNLGWFFLDESLFSRSFQTPGDIVFKELPSLKRTFFRKVYQLQLSQFEKVFHGNKFRKNYKLHNFIVYNPDVISSVEIRNSYAGQKKNFGE